MLQHQYTEYHYSRLTSFPGTGLLLDKHSYAGIGAKGRGFNVKPIVYHHDRCDSSSLYDMPYFVQIMQFFASTLRNVGVFLDACCVVGVVPKAQTFLGRISMEGSNSTTRNFIFVFFLFLLVGAPETSLCMMVTVTSSHCDALLSDNMMRNFSWLPLRLCHWIVLGWARALILAPVTDSDDN
ncbi:hypothetical protein DM860_018077 [Cuscuta australis]|uniref:Uncharacterized protein n=1 Tax=Cuscuta australis TaxID=267555 RepID=A0A328E867_9ASTE|nr:hypothetical protein DM860_018077 [Cuscuta australis]